MNSQESNHLYTSSDNSYSCDNQSMGVSEDHSLFDILAEDTDPGFNDEHVEQFPYEHRSTQIPTHSAPLTPSQLHSQTSQQTAPQAPQKPPSQDHMRGSYHAQQERQNSNNQEREQDPASMFVNNVQSAANGPRKDYSIHSCDEATKVVSDLSAWVQNVRKHSPEDLQQDFGLVSLLKELNMLSRNALALSQYGAGTNHGLQVSRARYRNSQDYSYNRPYPKPNIHRNLSTPASLAFQPMNSPGTVTPREQRLGYYAHRNSSISYYGVPTSPKTPSQNTQVSPGYPALQDSPLDNKHM